MMLGGYNLNKLTPVLSDVLCVAGLIIASHRTLQRKVAVTQLLPPPVDDKVLEPAPEPVVVGWRKFVTKKAFKSYAFLICYLGAQFFCVYVLPRIGSRMFLDIFWGALISAMVFCVSGCASTVIVPDPVAVSLERVKPDSPLTTKNHELAPERKWTGYLRTALALANTAAVMVSAYYGSTVIQGVATAAWLMMLVRGTYFVRVRVKRITQVLMAVLISVPALVFAIMAVVGLFKGDSKNTSSGTSSSSSLASPSPWILSVMMIAGSAFPVLLPGMLIAVTLRFEHARVASPQLRTSGPVPVPLKLDRFPRPIFNAGIWALASSLATIHVVTRYCSADPQVTASSCGLFLTTPVALMAMMFAAKKRGILREYMEFSECWVPNKAEAEEIRMIHAEQAMSDEEKTDAKVKASEEAQVETTL